MDSNSDPSGCEATDPDMTLSNSPGQNNTMDRVIVLATQHSLVLVTAQLSDTNMVTSCGLDPVVFGVPMDHQTSTQTLAVVGPLTQMWSTGAAQPGCHHDPR